MYPIGTTILYGGQGACQICDIEKKEIGGQRHSYYVLKPVYDSNATIFVPTENEQLVGKMRRVLSRQEVQQLIDDMPEETTIWVDNDSQRKEQYQKILFEGNPKKLIRLIKTLHKHQEEQREKGRRLHLSDERAYKEAERLLYDEFALALNIERKEVLPFILNRIEM